MTFKLISFFQVNTSIDEQGDTQKARSTSTVPPTEEILLQNTLWPEVQKLYGHGYELFTLATNHSNTLLASACKAATAKHAAIILWDLGSFSILAHLQSHALTVTRLAFSPDDRYLLSVSRDRTWSLFAFSIPSAQWIRLANSDKKIGLHSRIIWDAAWTPDSRAFVTVSRDKTAVVWQLIEEPKENTENSQVQVVPRGQLKEIEDSITALDILASILGDNQRNEYVAALGTESGALLLYSFTLEGQWTKLYEFDATFR